MIDCDCRQDGWTLEEASALVERANVAYRISKCDAPVDDDRYARLISERGAAAHETGHALVNLANGNKLLAVTIANGRPATISTPLHALPPLLAIIAAAAGHCAEGMANYFSHPTKDCLFDYISLAREGKTANCDYCRAARRLCEAFPSLSDGELVEVWDAVFQVTERLLRKPVFQSARYRIADALRDHMTLSGDDIAALVDVDALREAQGEALVGVNVNDPKTWGLHNE